MKQRGFTLLELVISLLLSSMLGTVLFTTFFQSSRTLRFVDEYAEVDSSMATILKQMERDVAGALEPVYRAPPKNKEAEAQPDEPNKEKKKERAPSFIAKEKNKQLDYVSFVTTNPRSRFAPPLPTSVAKPSLVRVMYKLREAKERKDRFVLIRQESTNLAIASFAKKSEKPPRELIVSDAVEKCSIEYLYDIEGEEGQPETKTATEWGKKSEEKIPPLPRVVKISLTVWDSRAQLKRSIDYYMQIYTTFVEPKPQPQKNNKAAQAAITSATQSNGTSRPKPKRRTLAEFLRNGGTK
jgi:prepilin-type N-terminal cleavage/methylation domain-containing protein